MTSNAIVCENGEITIPAYLLEELGWHIGDDVAIENTDHGLVVSLHPAKHPTS